MASKRKSKKRQDRMAKEFLSSFGKPKKTGHRRAKSRGTAGFGHPSGYWGKNPPLLVATKKNGKRVKANTSVKMKLSDLRKLISGARSGKKVRVKARVR